MGDYDDFPPLILFKIVLHSCPQSAFIYICLWKIRSNSLRVCMKRKDIKKKFLISPTLFRNHLLAIARLDILSFDESTESFTIDFASIDNV